MTLKSSPLVWSLAFMVVAFLALTKGAPTTKEEEEIQDHPYSFLIHHPSESGSIIGNTESDPHQKMIPIGYSENDPHMNS